MTTTKKANRILSFLIAIIMVLPLFTELCSHRAHAEISDNWWYTVSNGYATITKYDGESKSTLTIPAKLDGYNVTKVTGLFSKPENATVTHLKFSTGIMEIGDYLCKDYAKLTKITLPSTLRTIGENAFENCPKLTAATIPANVTKMGDNVFKNCTSLKKIIINGNVSTIPYGSFSGCTKLETLNLSSNTKTISDYAFENCTSIKNLDLPDSIETIGVSAFTGCSGITGTVTLPAKLKDIKKTAFRDCANIKTIVIPNSIRRIEEFAFENCSSMTSAVIGKGVTKIEQNAFKGCTSLRKVIFGGDYLNLSNVFDINYTPSVYYSTEFADRWQNYSNKKKFEYSPITSITISGNKTIVATKTMQLKVKVSPSNTNLVQPYYITTSNTNVATVNSDGVVTGVSGGTATITVTAINGTEKSITVKINPTKVKGVEAKAITTSSVEVSWDESSNVTGYIIYRSTSKSSGYKKVGTSLTNSYTDKGLTKGKTYYYKVRAYVKSGSTTLQSSSSSYASVKATSPTPTSVSAKKSASKVALIKWGKSIGAEGYEVYMATSKSGTYSKISTIKSGSTLSYKKTGLTSGKTYYFKVRSYITVNGKKVYSDYSKIVSCKV